MAQFQLSLRKTQKRGNTRDEYEDAYAYRNTTRIANPPMLGIALADGASESAFSQQWAQLLVDDYAAYPYVKRDTMLKHSRRLAAEWKNEVWKPDLPWYVEERIRIGAFSTLLGLRILKDSGRWKAISVGDTCLFQIHNDQLIRAWPLEKKEDFGRSPALLSTDHVALQGVRKRIAVTEGQANTEDTFVLATDALSAWFLEQNDKAKQPWLTLKEVDPHGFEGWIDKLRNSFQIRNDDVTCIICTVADA